MKNKYKTPEDIKKALKQMLDRPERFDPASIVEEKDESGKYSVENPDKPYSVPGQIRAGIKTKFEKPEVQQETDDSGEMKIESPRETYKEDPEITEMVRKLSRGESLDDETNVESENDDSDKMKIEDPYNRESKKQAIKIINKKYLGR